MRAITCAAPGRLEFTDIREPVRQPGQVLVRIRRVGVCGTDMHIYGGRQPFFDYPRVIGHELSGEVVESDSETGLSAGDTVTINPYLACGACHACRIGKTNCCIHLKVLGVHMDGGLTSYLSLPSANVIRVDGVGIDEAAMIEFLAVGAHAVARSGVGGGRSVLVAGGGPIGIGVALFAKLAGAEVLVADMRPERLAFCSEQLDVATIEVTPEITGVLRERTAGVFYDAVFDATGSPRSIEAQFSHVANGGTYTLVSIVKGDIAFSDSEFHRREITLHASRNALPGDFGRVISAMRSGLVPTRKLNTHRVQFDQLPATMPLLMDPSSGVIKALVDVT